VVTNVAYIALSGNGYLLFHSVGYFVTRLDTSSLAHRIGCIFVLEQVMRMMKKGVELVIQKCVPPEKIREVMLKKQWRKDQAFLKSCELHRDWKPTSKHNQNHFHQRHKSLDSTFKEDEN
jgi:hypothetical protein